MTNKSIIFSIFVLRECFATFFGEHYPHEIVSLIMKRDIDTCRVLEIKTSHVKELKILFDILKHSCGSVVFKFNSQNKILIISVLGSDKRMKINFPVDTCYCYVVDFYFKVDTHIFYDSLETVDDNFPLVLYVCNNSRHQLQLCIDS